jgi:2-oxoglutarate ferredoxin oxidoreductase subunit gamma
MLTQIIFAGFGGQGILTAGLLMANTAALFDKEVTWIPSYGSEMRGGTANCSVKISDASIASPFIRQIDYLVVMNGPSLIKFLPQVKPGGTVIIDSSIVKSPPKSEGLNIVMVPATSISEELHHAKGANICIIGALAGCNDIINKKQYEEGIKYYFAKYPKFNDSNIAVFNAGYDYVINGRRL